MTLSGMENIVQALGWTLLHSIWQIGLIALVFFLVISFLPQAKPEIHYGIGVLSLLLTAIISAGTFYEAYEAEKNAYQSATQQRLKETAWLHNDQPREVAEEAYELSSSWASVLATGQSWIDQRINWLVGAWLSGILLLGFRFGGSLLYLQRLKQRSVEPLPHYWLRKTEDMRELLMISRPVALLASGVAKTPMVIGQLKPVILIPASMLSGLSDDQLEAIIAHELAHIYRKDYWINLLQSALEILFFFHPALWWISSVVRAERENCCDDLAVRLCGNSLAYAKALARVEEIKVEQPAFALAFGGKRGGLLYRIERILQPGKKHHNLKARFLSVTLVMLSLLLILSTSESRALRYGSEKAKEALSWVKTSYLPGKVDSSLPLNEHYSQAPTSDIKSKLNKQIPALQDTIPAKPTAPRAYQYRFGTSADSTIAPFVVHLPDLPGMIMMTDSLALHSFHLQDSILQPLTLQMDSLSRVILKTFDDSSFVFNLNSAQPPRSPMAFNFGPSDSSMQMMVERAMILADSAMRNDFGFSHSFNTLAATLQDSTLEARLRELEKKMQAKEREMEALMQVREREIEMLLKEKAAELTQKEAEMMQKMREQEKALEQQMRQQEQKIKQEIAKLEAESIRINEGIRKLEALLIADELIEKGQRYNLKIKQDQILVNGEVLSNRLFNKYQRFLEKEDIFGERGNSISITRVAE